MNLHEKHMDLVDAVNSAKTDHEYWSSFCTLHGWRKGVEDAGGFVDLIAADLTQFERGFQDRPMCCGVFLDREENKKNE